MMLLMDLLSGLALVIWSLLGLPSQERQELAISFVDTAGDKRERHKQSSTHAPGFLHVTA